MNCQTFDTHFSTFTLSVDLMPCGEKGGDKN